MSPTDIRDMFMLLLGLEFCRTLPTTFRLVMCGNKTRFYFNLLDNLTAANSAHNEVKSYDSVYA